jgi:hypothetical protein
MYRCRRGDLAAQELAKLKICSNRDPGFKNCIEKNKLLHGTEVDFIKVEIHHQQFLQIPTESEAKEGFTRAFDELVARYTAKLVSMNTFTHLSLGMI